MARRLIDGLSRRQFLERSAATAAGVAIVSGTPVQSREATPGGRPGGGVGPIASAPPAPLRDAAETEHPAAERI